MKLIKFGLIIIGILAFLAIVGDFFVPSLTDIKINAADTISTNVPWFILVLCLGFCGIILAIEHEKEKK